MDWSRLPDLGAVALLASAFASVSRRSQTPISSLWLTGWVLIALHFAASILMPSPGACGIVATIVGLASLTWAGALFNAATVADLTHLSCRWMMIWNLLVHTLYIALLIAWPQPLALDAAALLFGLGYLSITVVASRTYRSRRRWFLAGVYCALSVFLLIFQNRPGNGSDLALNAVLFSVYLGCCIYFVSSHPINTTGAFITFAGFSSWASVFVVAPCIGALFSHAHVESEIWNLPKYVVAVGMILLLLEDQIEHNRYLALHDELTALPNRRLFQDRLTQALERARRTGTHAALLLVDLDHFKQVNDTLGHQAGDEVLRRVAAILSSRVRRSDTVARTGGDEFSIVLSDPAGRADAERLTRSLISLIERPFVTNGQMVQIGASVGIAVFPEDANAMEALCVTADVRMYKEKQTTRKKCELASEAAGFQVHFPTIPARSPL